MDLLQSSNVVSGVVYKMPKMGPCEADSGSPVVDMDMDVVTRINKVEIKCSTAINSLRIQFERNDQEVVWTPWWGSTDGDVVNAINLDPDEYFTRVIGHVGRHWAVYVVRSLTFFTNKKTYGPFGEQDLQYCALFDLPLPAGGGKIVGFHGRAGSYLDAFGIYYEMP